jgi:hypothetical protein
VAAESGGSALPDVYDGRPVGGSSADRARTTGRGSGAGPLAVMVLLVAGAGGGLAWYARNPAPDLVGQPAEIEVSVPPPRAGAGGFRPPAAPRTAAERSALAAGPDPLVDEGPSGPVATLPRVDTEKLRALQADTQRKVDCNRARHNMRVLQQGGPVRDLSRRGGKPLTGGETQRAAAESQAFLDANCPAAPANVP